VGSFVSGRELSRQLYRREVRPLLDTRFPGLPHGAALLGRGSEVLGYDDEMSRDHDWGPRVLVFLNDDDHARLGRQVDETLRSELPAQFAGSTPDCPVRTVRAHVRAALGVDVDDELEARDWLTFPEHELLMLTAGVVHHDDVGLQAVRDRFGYYPHDLWLYLMAAAWWRVGPEANLLGRVGYVGDELGSALIGADLVHDLMRLCLLQERQYAPYSKWFATAFSRLPGADDLAPLLGRVLRAPTWPEREDALLAAYAVVATRHDALDVTDLVPTQVERMWDRPFRVLWGDFPGDLLARITDPAVLRLAEEWPIGGPDRVRALLWGAPARRKVLRLLD
jgi:hypothetical protein